MNYQIINYIIASVWIANGFFCKVLNLVPRHQLIVSEILGYEHGYLLTKIIGLLEIGMAVWILSKIKTRLNTITQIIIIALMNTIEFIIVPDLLLFGKFNAVVAGLFVLLIYCNEFLV